VARKKSKKKKQAKQQRRQKRQQQRRQRARSKREQRKQQAQEPVPERSPLEAILELDRREREPWQDELDDVLFDPQGPLGEVAEQLRGILQPKVAVPAALLGPCRKQRCLPPLHVDRHGRPVPDPWQSLGLQPRDGSVPHDEVRAAYRQRLLAAPPESDPQRARLLREARDRLCDPRQVLDRELGVLHLPDPQAWDLPGEDESSAEDGLLPAADRIVGQLFLYALLEDRLGQHAPVAMQTELPF